ncbi:MAG: HD domain-containing protein [Acidimicrobiales bacterium]
MIPGLHLARRFFGSLSSAPPPPADEAWAMAHLVPGERELWQRMSNPDRRHAVGVARAVVADLGPDAGREVVAAALLHDVGKVVSGFGTFRRVGATLVWEGLERARPDPQRAVRWAHNGRLAVVRRLGQYRRHPELGAELLAAAGAHELTVAWAREHHRRPARWTVPPEVGAVLKSCDDD